MTATAAMYRRLAQPPGRLLRTWLSAAETVSAIFAALLAFLALFYALGILVLLASLYLGLHSLADVLGTNYNDTLGAVPLYAAAAALLSVAVVLPQVLTAWAGDLVALRATLQASLTARFPVETPDQAACRGCGAPLDVPRGATCVRCPFCDTDNLTAIPRERLAALAELAHWHFHSVEDAVRKEREYRRDSRAGLRAWAWGTAAGVAVAAAFGALFQAVDLDADPPRWSTLTQQAAAIVVSGSGTPLTSVPFGVDATVPADGDCYWMALRRGDVVRLGARSVETLGTPRLRNSTTFEGPMIDRELPWNADGARGFVAVFTAPYTGRFCVQPRAARDAAPRPTLRLDVVVATRP
jgi:LSD1 subclass zinc finger protein